MSATFEDQAVAARTRDVIKRIAIKAIDEERPPYRYATVTMIDQNNRVVNVNFPGDSTDIPVKILGMAPSVVGQVVQVSGRRGDLFISGVVGDSATVEVPEADLGTPAGLTLDSVAFDVIADWNSVTGASRYEVQFANDANFTVLVRSFQTVSTRFTLDGLNEGDTIHVRVRARSNSGAGPWSGSQNIVVAGFPVTELTDGQPPSESPQPVVSGGLGFLLAEWLEISNPDLVTYDIHLSTQSGFTPTPDNKKGSTTGTFFFISSQVNGDPLEPETTYFVRIVARDADGQAPPGAQGFAEILTIDLEDVGDIQHGDIIGDGSPPSSSPDVGDVHNGVGFLYVTWNLISNPDPVMYEIHVSTTSGFTPSSNTYVGETSGNWFFIRNVGPGDGGGPLEYGPTYYVRIRAKDIDGIAPAGAQGSGESIQIETIDLGDLSVDTSKIENSAITTQKLLDGAVETLKVANDAITAAKIATGAITEVKVAPNAISETKIANDSISTPKIKTNAITANEISAGAVEAEKIAANAITAGKIAANAIDADHIAAGAVNADKIAANAITAGHITSNAITAGKIAANAITAQKIAAGAIEADKIAANAITAVKIAANAITAEKISTNAVLAEHIQAWTITATRAIIADAAIDNAKISNASISTAKIQDLAVGSAKIANATIGTAKIANAAITNAKIGNLAVDTANIATAAITSAKIANLAVTNAKIGSAAITTAKIGDAQITNAKIVSLQASKITAGTITASISMSSPTINGGTVTGAVLRTSASGARVLINGNTDQILFYNSAGTATALYQGNTTGMESSGSLRLGGTHAGGFLYCRVVHQRTQGVSREWRWSVSGSGIYTLQEALATTWGTAFQFAWGGVGSAYFRPGNDNAVFLGTSGRRWRTVYSATGSINTSDDEAKDFLTTDVELGMNLVRELPAAAYRLKDGQRLHYGWSAQGLRGSLQRLGVNPKDFAGFVDPSVEPDDEHDDKPHGLDDVKSPPPKPERRYLGIRPSEMTSVLWAAMRELDAEVAELKSQLQELQA